MTFNQKHTALLVFSLSAKKEKERKAIFGKQYRKDNETFVDLLIQKTRDVAYRAGIDVVWMDERHQRGDFFSERISNAFEELFNAGYENVISIGNDCPDLSVDIIKGSIKELKTKKMVLGPANDGGVYLLGIHKSIFDKTRFLELPWQKATLLSEFINYAKNQDFDFVLLDCLKDLDSFKDALTYSKERPLTHLARFFKTILTFLKNNYFTSSDVVLPNRYHAYNGLRAPPQV